MPNIETLLNAGQFEGLAIDKTPTGYTVSILTEQGWSPFVSAATAAQAIAAALVPPCPIAIPPCPVPAS